MCRLNLESTNLKRLVLRWHIAICSKSTAVNRGRGKNKAKQIKNKGNKKLLRANILRFLGVEIIQMIDNTKIGSRPHLIQRKKMQKIA